MKNSRGVKRHGSLQMFLSLLFNVSVQEDSFLGFVTRDSSLKHVEH